MVEQVQATVVLVELVGMSRVSRQFPVMRRDTWPNRLWREELIYGEGERGFMFFAGWGSEQPTMYVPSTRIWDLAVPECLRGRREEVVRHLEVHSGHRLCETEEGYPPYKHSQSIYRRHRRL